LIKQVSSIHFTSFISHHTKHGLHNPGPARPPSTPESNPPIAIIRDLALSIHLRKPCISPTPIIIITTTTTTNISIPPKTDLNAPISTLPIDLITPPLLPPSALLLSKVKRYIEYGRTYLTFYKTGLKNVYRNYRASLPLRRKLGLPSYLPTSPPRTISPSNTH
jgi:hypothetical protein